MQTFARYLPAEITYTGTFLLLMTGLSVWFDLPIISPSLSGVVAAGIHYLAPVLAMLVWVATVATARREHNLSTVVLAFPCYALVLWVHFNIKLWVPLINPINYDQFLWTTDEALRPLVDLCIFLRQAIGYVLPNDRNLYLFGFIAMFYMSFCYHGLFTPKVFRKLFLSALLLQIFGTIGYVLMPAVGPFLYEPGANPLITGAQGNMLDIHERLLAGGTDWLSQHGTGVLFAGLGAMPSLHAGSSFLFLWFAIRHGRPLLSVYIPIFGYILVTAVGNRWHYLLDLPVGIALAASAIYLAGLADALRESPIEATESACPSPRSAN